MCDFKAFNTSPHDYNRKLGSYASCGLMKCERMESCEGMRLETERRSESLSGAIAMHLVDLLKR